MYTKLFARITESSLMEEEIPVRYTFVILIAIADPSGLVVGTDIAIARRLNMPIEQFKKCIEALQSPDTDSNSKEFDGRRVVPSDGERGYQIVNFAKYRDLKDEDERRVYMRNYMRNYRNGKQPVNLVNNDPAPLAELTQEDVEEEGDGDKEEKEARTPAPAERPSLEEVKAYAVTIGLAEWKARDWLNEMEGCGWRDFRNRNVVNWRALLNRVRTKWEADGRPAGPPASKQAAPKILDYAP